MRVPELYLLAFDGVSLVMVVSVRISWSYGLQTGKGEYQGELW